MGVVPRTPDGDRHVAIDEMRLRGPADVVAWAAHDHTLGWMTWPEVWHLDAVGALHCFSKGSSIESARTWADDPEPLLRSRREGVASTEGCAPDWVIIDSRQRFLWRDGLVSEADAHAYDVIGAALASVGVRLLDLMVFDDSCNWWSVGQLVNGEPCDHPAASWPGGGWAGARPQVIAGALHRGRHNR
jgi:hypothetical protein